MNKEELNKLFEYRDGEIYWKPQVKRGFTNSGKRAGTVNKGYLWVKSNQLPKQTSVHRIVWEMHNGAIPEGMVIDHINRDPLDNRIENLRVATRSQNSMNAVGKAGKKSGLPKGVYKDWEYGGVVKYRAQVIKDGECFRVGGLTLEEASEMVGLLYEEMFGEFKVQEEEDE